MQDFIEEWLEEGIEKGVMTQDILEMCRKDPRKARDLFDDIKIDLCYLDFAMDLEDAIDNVLTRQFHIEE